MEKAQEQIRVEEDVKLLRKLDRGGIESEFNRKSEQRTKRFKGENKQPVT